ncbi:MAG: homocysteine S-methyltransferase [Arcobacter sp.]|nr:MAG: homocysteine S-methyltransferase [Arcobacter sp.]
MNLITQILEKQNVFIIDGALGTQLQKKGYDVNDSLWSAKFLNENPDAIALVHKEYLEAGANCIITASYQASYEGFIKKGFTEGKAKELIQSAITLAQKTRDDYWNTVEDKENRIKPLVAASIGPYGAYLADGSEYSGNYGITDEELKEFHKRRLDVIIETSPDILACETIPTLKEAQILSDLLKDKNIASWITFSAKDGTHINSGDEITKCMSWLNDQNHISAVGINCTAPQFISPLIEKTKQVCNKPIVIYPNGGSEYNPITKKWEDSNTNAEFGKMAHLWNKQGATLIGGCCQTGPEEIKDLVKYLLPTIK